MEHVLDVDMGHRGAVSQCVSDLLRLYPVSGLCGYEPERGDSVLKSALSVQGRQDFTSSLRNEISFGFTRSTHDILLNIGRKDRRANSLRTPFQQNTVTVEGRIKSADNTVRLHTVANE